MKTIPVLIFIPMISLIIPQNPMNYTYTMFNRPQISGEEYLAAIKAGNIADVHHYLRRYVDMPSEINLVDEHGTPALALALMHNQFQIAAMMLDNKADASLMDSNGVTALMLAARSGRFDIVIKIIASNVKTSAVYQGLNAVEMAALNGHSEVVMLLLRSGAYIQCPDLYDRLTTLSKFKMIATIDSILDERLNQLGIRFKDLSPRLKSMILGLSKNNLKRCQKVIENLERNNQLTPENLLIVLPVVLIKNPAIKPQPSDTTIDADNASSIGEWKYFSDMIEQDSGGQALIYHGYASADAALPQVPDYTLKAFKVIDSCIRAAEARALREAQYLTLAGRRAAVTFDDELPLVIFDWHRGENMEKIVKEKPLEGFPIHRRVKWLVTALTDLDYIHANFRIHSDIKLQNLVLDLDTDVMRLIDLGAAHKINTPKSVATTRKWVDPNEGSPQQMASDMYMMGMVIARIFPELFEHGYRQIRIKSFKGFNKSMFITPLIPEHERTYAEQVIYSLVDAMLDKMATMRCSSQQALACCKLLLEKIDTKADEINPEDMQAILDATINRDYFTVDDALRDTRRPEFFRIPDEVMHAAENVLSGSERMSGEKYSDSPSTHFQPGDKKKRRVDPEDESKPKLR